MRHVKIATIGLGISFLWLTTYWLRTSPEPLSAPQDLFGDSSQIKPADSDAIAPPAPTVSPLPEPYPVPASHNFAQIESMLSRDHPALVLETDSDGTKRVHLHGSHGTLAAAQRQTDGSLLIQCFESFSGIEKFLLNPQPQPSFPARQVPLATR